MIASMLAYEIFIWTILPLYYDSMPYWLRGVLLVSWVAVHYIAFASEDKLRDRVKQLEDELKEHTKGGAE